jgi:outer membrane protein assembly factor BamA
MQPVASAGVDDFAGKRIAEIRFEPGRQPFDDSEVPLLIPFRQGDLLRTDLVSKAIEQLFATGRYTDIAVDASMSGDGVVITFQTELAWFVGSVNVVGVPEPPNRGEMLSATGVELGAEFQQEQVERAVVEIEQRLQANGFQQPKLRTQLDRDAVNHQVHVRFVVEPEKRAKLTQPVIQGDPQRSASDILKDTRWRKYFGLGGYHLATERRVQQGLERVRRGYQNRSHLMAKVELDRLEQLPGRVRPHVIIEAGPRIEVRATGMKLSRGKLRELVPIYTERSVDRELLAEGSRNILEYLR